jgi:selenophosphate synthetase-related protein
MEKGMKSKLPLGKIDPITHVTGEIGHLAVHINANDIASMGGSPLWFLATILVPSQTNALDIKRMILSHFKWVTFPFLDGSAQKHPHPNPPPSEGEGILFTHSV